MNYSSCWQIETNRKLAKGNEILQQIYQQLHKTTKFYIAMSSGIILDIQPKERDICLSFYYVCKGSVFPRM